jgi:hypothetical protein
MSVDTQRNLAGFLLVLTLANLFASGAIFFTTRNLRADAHAQLEQVSQTVARLDDAVTRLCDKSAGVCAPPVAMQPARP